MSTGRVSSREAERATRETVCTKASVGSVTRVSGAGCGSVGKSSARSVRRWKVVGAADQLDVLLGGCAAPS